MESPKIEKVFIIAEVGVNHNGNMEIARQLVEVAAAAGADAVKFQTFNTSDLVTKKAKKADYQKDSSSASESQYEMLSNLELGVEQHKELLQLCREQGVVFLSSPFGLESIDFLNSLGVSPMKIPSGEIVNPRYLQKIGQLGKEVILSTGMSNLGEIETALDILVSEGMSYDQITLLHCNTEYPTPFVDVNLKAMHTLRAAFPGVTIGYSDHTLGIEVSIAAVAMGAQVIEKHFTLDKNLPGPDHKASLSPEELTAMVSSIRNVEIAFGNGIKRASPSEEKNKAIARRTIVASKSIQKGEFFSETNICLKRAGAGINPMRWDEFIGTPALKNYQKDELI